MSLLSLGKHLVLIQRAPKERHFENSSLLLLKPHSRATVLARRCKLRRRRIQNYELEDAAVLCAAERSLKIVNETCCYDDYIHS